MPATRTIGVPCTWSFFLGPALCRQRVCMLLVLSLRAHRVTWHVGGHAHCFCVAVRFKAAEKRLKKLQTQLDEFDIKHGVKLSRDCLAAFVVFNCEDSKRHCVNDYAHSDTWRQVFQVWVLPWSAQALSTQDAFPCCICCCGVRCVIQVVPPPLLLVALYVCSVCMRFSYSPLPD